MNNLVFTYNSTRTDCLSKDGVSTDETHEITSDRGVITVRLTIVNGEVESKAVTFMSKRNTNGSQS